MNQFLACFLACAFVQALSVIIALQYTAWKSRKDDAESSAGTAQAIADSNRHYDQIIADSNRIHAEAQAEYRAENARHDARMAKLDQDQERLRTREEMRRRSDMMDVAVGLKPLTAFPSCPMCGVDVIVATTGTPEFEQAAKS